MYRPNFCCECGERVLRARWRVWTSRRFCQACGRRFRRARLRACVALACALFAPGFLLGRLSGPTRPPLVLERGGAGVAPLPALKDASAGGVGVGAGVGGAAAKPEPAYGPDGAANERPTDPDETVYICGARTQKGTPCQRRVRGPGRCWQHRGKPAILPPSKLVVQG
ncbi:MAG TPA: hypothetical protein VF668_12150 [Pyrinomonadaceae bacterium]